MRRLATLLRLRRHQETVADSALAGASRERIAAHAMHEALQHADPIVGVEPQPRTLPELLALRMQGLAGQERLEAAADTVALRTRDESDARVVRVAAAVRRRSVQRAVERRDYEQMMLAQRATRRALSELARLKAVQR